MANNIDINKTIGEVDKLNASLQETAERIKGIIELQKNSSKELNTVKGLTDTNEKLNKTKTAQNQIEIEGEKLLRQRNTLIAKQAAILKPLTLETVKQREALKEQNKQLRDQARASLGLKKTAGLFKTMTKSILSAAGAMMGLTALFRTLKNAGKLVLDFQKANAELAGVLNKTRSEISALTKDAERLGATTAKTASEVTALQTAYARLGFTQEEILNLTGDTINGSIALNAELDQTAELTGAVVRSFDEFSSTDAGKILDIMTASTQKTALNFTKLETAIPIVAGAASAAKVPFTTMIAQLGQAADRGIDASTAATSLRNIYLELSKKGLTLDEALKQINTSQDKLSTANELFGKRAAVTALALANTTDKTKELDSALQDSGGTAKKVADEQLNTLKGSIDLLNSAWQGFILSIENGDGIISKFVNGTLKTFADALTELANLDLIFTRDSKLTIEQVSRTYDILSVLNNKLGRNFRKFREEYDDESSRWLQDNKETVINYLKELDFSNKEAELLYNEHLARVMNNELVAIDAALAASKRKKDVIVNDDKEITQERISNLDKIENESYKKEQAITDFIREQVKERLGEQVKYSKNLSQQLLDRYKKNKEYFEKVEEAQKQSVEIRKEIEQQLINSGIEIANTLFDLGQSQRERELEGIRSNYAAKIAAAEGNTELQEKLSRELAVKEAQIQREQAKSERNQALFNLAITTAQRGLEIKAAIAAAMAASAVLGPAGPAIYAPVIGMAWTQLGFLLGSAVLQAGLIASQPLPEIPGFFKGTENAPAGLAWVAEHGAELITTKSGEQYLAKEKQIVNFSGGEKVDTAADTQRLLNSAIYNDIAVNGNNGLETRIDKLISEVKNLNQLNVNFDEKGMTIYAQQGKSITKYLNSKGRK